MYALIQELNNGYSDGYLVGVFSDEELAFKAINSELGYDVKEVDIDGPYEAAVKHWEDTTDSLYHYWLVPIKVNTVYPSKQIVCLY